MQYSTLYAYDTEFIGNEAGASGGALDLSRYCHLMASNLTMRDNFAPLGGAIRLDDHSHIECNGCDFRNNTATESDGGAIVALTQTVIEFDRSYLGGNVAEQSGGFAALSGYSRAAFYHTTFDRNRAIAINGGALHVTDTLIDLAHVLATRNQAGYTSVEDMCPATCRGSKTCDFWVSQTTSDWDW